MHGAPLVLLNMYNMKNHGVQFYATWRRAQKNNTENAWDRALQGGFTVSHGSLHVMHYVHSELETALVLSTSLKACVNCSPPLNSALCSLMNAYI